MGIEDVGHTFICRICGEEVGDIYQVEEDLCMWCDDRYKDEGRAGDTLE